MLCVYFLVVVASLAVAEQPSHSYLPPSPTSRNNGYSRGAPEVPGFQGPQIVASRTTVERNSANAVARSSPSEYQASARAPSQGYDDNAVAFGRTSNESNSTVNYEADGRGFKPQISYQDSEDLTRSIDSNSNTRNYGNYKNGRQDARVSLYFLVVVASLAVAEQPSNSYLPPSPTSRNNGYFEGAPGVQGFQRPQVVAARTSVQGNSANGFARTSPSEYQASARSPSQGYDDGAAFARNSIDSNSEPANYNFGYMVSDFSEGTDFGHREERIEEKAQGQYHVVLPDGRKQTVNYEADERGFKPQISYEDSEDLTRSIGYNSNGNTRNYGNYKNGGQDARGY